MNAAEKLNNSSLFNGIVYGPVESRRYGASLGLDLLGREKACSFDCGYCDLGPSLARLNQLKQDSFLPSTKEILDAAQAAFSHLHANGPAIDVICISGNGEPTLHPEFLEVVKGLIDLRNLWLPGKPLIALSNGANLSQRKVVSALNLLDERVIKIDAGNEKIFKLVNAARSRVSLAQVLSSLTKLGDFTVQSMFIQGAVDNTKPADIEDWIEVIAMIRPKAVQIQGMSRPAHRNDLIAPDEDSLHSINAKLERRTGIRAKVYP